MDGEQDRPMKRTSLDEAICPVARSLDVIGDWWSLLIVRDALGGPRRFGEFQKNLGMAKNMLAARLKDLVARDVLVQQPAADGSKFQEYALTERGRALFPVIVALRDWGDRFLFAEGKCLSLVDKETGKSIPPLVVKSADGRTLRAGEALLVPADPH
jgi:DNA-binding HxlR family transcriptional regulator